ncbi:MAG: hypothetical protein A4E39_01677 [Methanoregulaceae archaeon PtaB.Bin152]|nr:MAG: hypothetical protein A4E39_01677 [Methanoregulaceae archaeon PtaB.Bin152]
MRNAAQSPAFQSASFRTRMNMTGTITAAISGGTKMATEVISSLVETPAIMTMVVVIQVNSGPHGMSCPKGYRDIASNHEYAG